MSKDYDIALIGLGPAGATLARLLEDRFSVLALDRKGEEDGGFRKPCGGLLAPDAQKAMARFELSLPVKVLVGPQIFSVRTMDMSSGRAASPASPIMTRDYQRYYLNLDRHAFDQWLISLIPPHVEIRKRARCTSVERIPAGYRVRWKEGARVNEATATYVVGADGALSLVRRSLFPRVRIRTYTAIQQWFEDRHPRPFYSCVFDSRLTDCYAWGLTKNEYFIFGGAFAPRHARQRFEELKRGMRGHGFMLDAPVRTEACAVLRPESPTDIFCGEAGAFLVGEAAGLISPSSLEGMSYAFESAGTLAKVLNSSVPDPNRAYARNTLPLRLRLLGKLVKCPAIFSPWLRKLIMMSGVGSISMNRRRRER